MDSFFLFLSKYRTLPGIYKIPLAKPLPAANPASLK